MSAATDAWQRKCAAKDAEIARLRVRVAELEADIPLKWQARQDEMQATIDAKDAEIAALVVALDALGSPAPVAGSPT